MIIEIIPTGNGSDVDVVINGEWQHTFDSWQTAIDSFQMDWWQQQFKLFSTKEPNQPYSVEI